MLANVLHDNVGKGQVGDADNGGRQEGCVGNRVLHRYGRGHVPMVPAGGQGVDRGWVVSGRVGHGLDTWKAAGTCPTCPGRWMAGGRRRHMRGGWDAWDASTGPSSTRPSRTCHGGRAPVHSHTLVLAQALPCMPLPRKPIEAVPCPKSVRGGNTDNLRCLRACPVYVMIRLHTGPLTHSDLVVRACSAVHQPLMHFGVVVPCNPGHALWVVACIGFSRLCMQI